MSTELEAPPPKEEKRWLGLYDDLDFEEYRKAPGMNNSGIKTFRKSPLTYITEKMNPKPTTHSFRVGHAFHCLVFEPEKFDQLYIKSKYEKFQTNESKIWRQTVQSRGMTVLTYYDSSNFWDVCEWDMVHRMADAVRKHPIAGIFCGAGRFELSGWFVDRSQGEDYEGTGRLCKFRMDNYNEDHRCIVDLKSTIDASYSGFQRACHKFDYNLQEAFYTTGARSQDIQLDVKNGMMFVVCESEPPWQVAVYKLDPNWVRQGAAQIQQAMTEWNHCKDKNEWPGYGWRSEVPVRDLVMPGYAKFQNIY